MKAQRVFGTGVLIASVYIFKPKLLCNDFLYNSNQDNLSVDCSVNLTISLPKYMLIIV